METELDNMMSAEDPFMGGFIQVGKEIHLKLIRRPESSLSTHTMYLIKGQERPRSGDKYNARCRREWDSFLNYKK